MSELCQFHGDCEEQTYRAVGDGTNTAAIEAVTAGDDGQEPADAVALVLDKASRDDAIYMGLNAEPISPQAFALIDALAIELWACAGRKRAKPSRIFKRALGAIIADLFRLVGDDPKRFNFRSMKAGDFKKERVGYTVFKLATDAMQERGLLEVVTGFVGSRKDKTLGQTTRFRAAAALLEYALRFGVVRAQWTVHFRKLPRPKVVAEPLMLRAGSSFVGGGKVKGERIPIDFTKHPASRLASQVHDINSFFSEQCIDQADHHHFVRIFSQGDDPAFNWNKGGRLYSVGQCYQQMKSAERRNIRLNEEPTVEIDIRASFLTIYHGLMGAPFDPDHDPYELPGLPRLVVKAWITMTFGYDKFHQKWSSKNKKRYYEEYGRDMHKEHPIKTVRDRLLDHFPVMKDWQTSKIRWGDLQYIESCAVIDAVHELAMKHGIPALPVHDSIIVPTSAQEIATKTLSDRFHYHIGVRPGISVK